MENGRDLNCDVFYFLVIVARSITATRQRVFSRNLQASKRVCQVGRAV